MRLKEVRIARRPPRHTTSHSPPLSRPGGGSRGARARRRRENSVGTKRQLEAMAKSPEMRAHAAAEVCRARFSDRRAAPRARDVVSPFLDRGLPPRPSLRAAAARLAPLSTTTQNSTRHHPPPRPARSRRWPTARRIQLYFRWKTLLRRRRARCRTPSAPRRRSRVWTPRRPPRARARCSRRVALRRVGRAVSVVRSASRVPGVVVLLAPTRWATSPRAVGSGVPAGRRCVTVHGLVVGVRVRSVDDQTPRVRSCRRQRCDINSNIK